MKAFEQVTVTDSVTALNSQIYSRDSGREICNKATIAVETASIRYRVDGGEPSATVGLLANSGDILSLIGRSEIKFFRAIRTTATSATLTVDYGVSNNE